MRILITGGTGFLGGMAARRFLQRGDSVVLAGRNIRRASELESLGAELHEVSLSDPEGLTRAAADCEAVVHCAALASPWGRTRDFIAANVEGTRHVLQAAESAKVSRFVQISTPSIYTTPADREDVRESDPLPDRFINDYAWTKKLAEDEVDLYAARGLAAITLRPQALIGEGDRVIFPRLLRVARKGVLPVIGDGHTRVDLTCVENVVDAIERALEAPSNCFGRKYNITNGEPVLFYPLVDEILERLKIQVRRPRISFRTAWKIATGLELTSHALGRPFEPSLTRYSVCVLGNTRTLNIDAARNELGYQPRVPLRDGIDRVVEAFR